MPILKVVTYQWVENPSRFLHELEFFNKEQASLLFHLQDLAEKNYSEYVRSAHGKIVEVTIAEFIDGERKALANFLSENSLVKKLIEKEEENKI